MPTHRLACLTIGTPKLDESIDYYTQFGLSHLGDGRFASLQGGEQLRLVPSPRRRLLEMVVGVDSEDDLARAGRLLSSAELRYNTINGSLIATDPATGLTIRLEVQQRRTQPPSPPAQYNVPGRPSRAGRHPGVVSDRPVRPRRLGHVFIGSRQHDVTMGFLAALGFTASDYVRGMGAFMRCSTDHHNILVLAAPISYLHHSAWEVADVDEVGRGAISMLQQHPERHVWGMGRHYVGSNFFWYLRDPAGNFTEYYADMDTIEIDQLWTPEEHEAARTLYSWGQPPPASFIAPDDLADLMIGSHA